MSKALVVMCFLLGAVFPSYAQLDSLKLPFNFRIDVDASIKKKYPIRWDSITNYVRQKTAKTYLENDYVQSGPEVVFTITSPCFESEDTDSTFTVSFLSNQDPDFCSQINLSKDAPWIEEAYLSMHSYYLKPVHRLFGGVEKRKDAHTYQLQFTGKGALSIPLEYGLKNCLAASPSYTEDKGSQERIIKIKLQKKKRFYVIEMRFASKTGELLMERPEKTGIRKVKKYIPLPVNPTKEDIWRVSTELNENIFLFLELNSQ